MRSVLVLLLGVAAMLAAQPAGAAVREAQMKNNSFQPKTLLAATGETVKWTNADLQIQGHTVTSNSGLFDSGTLAKGGVFTHVFHTPGSFPYHCKIHQGMTGRVDVRDLWLTGPPKPVVYGTRAVLRGLGKQGLSEVTIEELRDGSFKPLGPALTPVDGNFSLTVSPTGTTDYRAVAGGIESRVTVGVTPKLTVRASRVSGSTFTVRASTTPAQPGAPVALQRYSPSAFSWRTVTKKTLSARSAASFRITAKTRVRVRIALLRGVNGFKPGVSRTLAIGS